MSEKPTGVFVRLPITDDQAQEMYRAYCAAYASSSLTTRGTATQAALLAIGMPVRGAELEVVGWGLYPAGGSNLSIFTNSGRAVKWANHFGRTLYPIVRQSDAQAQIAARDAQIREYRMLLERIINKASLSCVRTLSGRDSRLLAGACADAREALKGGAA